MTVTRFHKSVRFRDFSYASDSTCFVTIVCQRHGHFFGEVADGEMYLTRTGIRAWVEWDRTLAMRPEVVEHAFIVMPNHVHGLFSLDSSNLQDGSHCDATSRRLQREKRSVSSIVSGYKGAVTRWLRAELGDPSFVLWQPGFHEHVVRSEKRFDAIREYILDNPVRWGSDRENPVAARG
jgi:putative transposase